MLFYENYNVTSEHSSRRRITHCAGKTCGRKRAALLVRRGPALGFHIGKDGVAQLDGLQLLNLLGWDLTCGFKAPPAVQQRAELLQMSVEALFRVVARVLGGDQKLPVRRF